MEFRKATLEDIDWIAEELAVDMFSLFDSLELLDITYLKTTFLSFLINTGICIVAIDKEIPVGCIGGICHPIIYNPNKKGLTELFWWVKEEYRGSSAGAKLLLLFEGEGLKNSVHYINMTIMPNTNLNVDSMVKRGYIEKESSYVRKI